MQSNLTWQCVAFSELTAAQLYAVLTVRSEVFVVEQNCVYLDMDGADPQCMHLIAWTDDKQIAAYLRLVPPGLKFTEASIGRVITSQIARGQGIGKQLIAKGLAQIQTSYPGQAVRIGAQQYLEKFYQSFGFNTCSEMYLEDDIAHVEMLLSAK